MPAEQSAAEMLKSGLYSFETWGIAIKIFLYFFVAGLILLIFKSILKAIARFIKRIMH